MYVPLLIPMSQVTALCNIVHVHPLLVRTLPDAKQVHGVQYIEHLNPNKSWIWYSPAHQLNSASDNSNNRSRLDSFATSTSNSMLNVGEAIQPCDHHLGANF